MKFPKLSILAIVMSSGLPAAQAQTFSVYIGAPTAQTTPHGGAVTETFDSFAGGVQNGIVSSAALASFTGAYNFTNSMNFAGAILPADQFGGAGGTGQYLAMGQPWTSSGNPFSLTLGSTSANYLGFWWSAGDTSNFIAFYNDGVLLTTITSADVFTILSGGGTITSVDNSVYNKSAYFGNPNVPFQGQNVNEPYAYFNIYAGTGTVFDEVRFDNGTGNSGFESDNHSLFSGTLTPTGAEVFVTTVPEPRTVLLFGMSIACLLFLRRRHTA